MTDQQTSIPVEDQAQTPSQTDQGQTQAKTPNNGGLKAIVSEVTKDAKQISEGVQALPKKRRIQLYAGLTLIGSVLLGALSGNFYVYILFGIFVPVGFGMLIIMSNYTGKDVLDEMEKNKQRQKQPQPQAPAPEIVEIHEEDKIHEIR